MTAPHAARKAAATSAVIPTARCAPRGSPSRATAAAPTIATSEATTDQNASSHITIRSVPSYLVLLPSLMTAPSRVRVMASITWEVMGSARHFISVVA